MLEKYRKMAHDAHLNGDRVTEEYYLQFADHYFRVIADQRQRQEEQRQPRRDERGMDDGDDRYASRDFNRDDADNGDDGSDSDDRGYAPRNDRQPRQPRGGDDDGGERTHTPRGDRQPRQSRSGDDDDGERQHAPRGERAPAPRSERPARKPRVVADNPEVDVADNAPVSAEAGSDDHNPFEPADNPFTRDARSGDERGSKGLKPRRGRPPRDEAPADAPGDNGDAGDQAARPTSASDGLDPATLPPSISRDTGDAEAEAEAPPPKPRRRAVRRKAPAEDSADDSVSVAG